jgi:hypothetical protein
LRLFENAVQRPWGKVVIRMTRNGYPTPFGWVLVLAVTSTRYNEKPAIVFEQLDNPADFHGGIITRLRCFSNRNHGRKHGNQTDVHGNNGAGNSRHEAFPAPIPHNPTINTGKVA